MPGRSRYFAPPATRTLGNSLGFEHPAGLPRISYRPYSASRSPAWSMSRKSQESSV
ncbi:uncharacterized protein TRAVEDRAFT_31428 [Trametes versicolor FP-101664 SS1]|uniref:uncharacterized protein n=1 Tax=Trametes versicolor (strain FP-101664) TaxID=717944 RepID=UPI0004621989|nr:uncharacterized protein TRAVEDRAFT_31428 [Trametes versicolor FP-101664 SS1]EIW54576.1 hypothetical protein TRAVEDRAFT_31428 [Trametes versicolor FP-101664 SS1]